MSQVTVRTKRTNRRFCPGALTGVLSARIPEAIAQRLHLPVTTQFSELDELSIPEIRNTDRQLFDALATVVRKALSNELLHYLDDLAFPNGVSDVDLSELELTTRTWNCLVSAGLDEPHKLAKATIGDLLNIRAFGVKCLVDLLTTVDGAPCEARRAHLASDGQGCQQHSVTSRDDTKAIPVARLKLPVRARKCLSRLGISTIGELLPYKPERLLREKNFGRTSLTILQNELARLGIDYEEGRYEVPEIRRQPERANEVCRANARTISELYYPAALIREARLLANEPWASQVVIDDMRLCKRLSDRADISDSRCADEGFWLDQPVCTAPIVNDVNLLSVGLSTRARNCLIEAGLSTLRSLENKTVRDLLNIHGFGEVTVVELLKTTERCRFLTSRDGEDTNGALTADGTCEQSLTLADFCDEIVSRRVPVLDPDVLQKCLHDIRVAGIRCVRLTLEEELTEIGQMAPGMNHDAALEYLGWDGRGRRTLEEIGERHGITRERVRQIKKRTTDYLSRSTVYTPALKRAIVLCRQSCPVTAIRVGQLLQEEGITETSFHPHGILVAAETFGLDHGLLLRKVRDTEWVFCKGESNDEIDSVLSLANRIVSSRGLGTRADLAAEFAGIAGRTANDVLIQQAVESASGMVWLDAEKQWFYIPTARNVLGTLIRKILSVARRIHVSELRSGLTRHYRLVVAPPKTVLLRLCEILGYRVQDKYVENVSPSDPADILSNTEYIFYETLEAGGPLMARRKLEDLCLAKGMNRSTFWVYITYTPIIERYAPGVYGLRGAEFQPGAAEGLCERKVRRKVLTEFGWTNEGAAWLAYKLSSGLIESGVCSMPAGMRDALGNGTWPLFSSDGMKMGTLVSKGTSMWGLSPFFRRRGADVGDFVVVEIHRAKDQAVAHIGGDEILDAFIDPDNVSA